MQTFWRPREALEKLREELREGSAELSPRWSYTTSSAHVGVDSTGMTGWIIGLPLTGEVIYLHMQIPNLEDYLCLPLASHNIYSVQLLSAGNTRHQWKG